MVTEVDAATAGDPPFPKMDPTEPVEPGSDRTVRYSVLPTWLGRTLVAEMKSGVCAVLVGDDDGVLEADLAERFRGFQLSPQTAASSLTQRVAERIDGADVEIPLSLNGTEFQRLVWSGLLEIPHGETRTYSQLAERIGKRGSVRAVARACGANPAAVLVPCHRVVRGDGSISGYRWGVERKLALLQREQSREVPGQA